MDELSDLKELADRRKQAERLYKEAVENLDIKPTPLERQTAIKQIMDALEEE